MKLNLSKISINEIVYSNPVGSVVINTFFYIFFTFIRIWCKIFTHKNGNVLIISFHKLGDTIFTFPAIQELEKRFGDQIKIICYPESIPIYKLMFEDIEYIPIEPNEFFFGGRFASRRARKKIYSLKPKIIFDLTGTMVSASLIFNSRAKKIVGSNGIHFKAIFDHYIHFRTAPKLIDMYLDAISPIVDTSKRPYENKTKIKYNSNGRILIQPFAGWKEKEWNLKKFAELAERLNKIYTVNIIIQHGQLSHDIEVEIKSKDIEIIQTKSVEDLVEQIKYCSCFIGNDSGPVNIANFLGKPTLTFFGATNHEFTDTNVDYQDFIIKELKCSAKQNEKYCAIGLAVYKCSGIQCMNFITINEVQNRLIPMLDRYCEKRN